MRGSISIFSSSPEMYGTALSSTPTLATPDTHTHTRIHIQIEERER